MAARVYTAVDLYKIARNQRWLLLLILTNILAYISILVISAAAPRDATDNQAALFGLLIIAIVCLVLIVAVVWIVVLILMLVSLKTSGVTLALFVIGSFLPVISLIVLLIASSIATRALKNAGHKVGLIGVSRATLKQLKAASEQAGPPMPAMR